MKKNKIKVAIAMSGGVDSSVAAKLLLDQGYEVVGFMMKLWSESDNPGRENACCDIKGVEDARRVANQLNIPFYLIDARAEFKKHVVDYFIEEYKNLRTPNPCVVCNEKIKFGWLLDFAKKAGCDMLATGHYARITGGNSEISNYSKTIPSSNIQGDKEEGGNDKGAYHLLKAKDENKDQSYFLYNLNQDQLSKILFPIGQFTKSEVREMAKKWNLPVHEKKESQEICFIKEKDFREFLHRHIPKELFKAGEIVDSKGNIVGKHDGLINYTIGQRRGIEQDGKVEAVIPAKAGIQKNTILDPRVISTPPNLPFIRGGTEPEDDKVGSEKQPFYVVGYDIEKNRLIVGEDREAYKDKMIVENLSWINSNLQFSTRLPDGQVNNLQNITVKIRYRHPAVPCKLVTRNSLFVIRFDKPQRAITPGQSAVFYDGDEVLSGGIIE